MRPWNRRNKLLLSSIYDLKSAIIIGEKIFFSLINQRGNERTTSWRKSATDIRQRPNDCSKNNLLKNLEALYQMHSKRRLFFCIHFCNFLCNLYSKREMKLWFFLWRAKQAFIDDESSSKAPSSVPNVWWKYESEYLLVHMVYPMSCESHSVSENYPIDTFTFCVTHIHLHHPHAIFLYL